MRNRRSLKNSLTLARDANAEGVHLIGHGIEHQPTAFCAGEDVEDNLIDLANTNDRNLFRGLFSGVKESWLLLSCCFLGGHPKELIKLREVSNCGAIFAYHGELEEYQAFLMDALFYQLVLGPMKEHRGTDQPHWQFIRRRLGQAADSLVAGARVGGSY